MNARTVLFPVCWFGIVLAFGCTSQSNNEQDVEQNVKQDVKRPSFSEDEYWNLFSVSDPGISKRQFRGWMFENPKSKIKLSEVRARDLQTFEAIDFTSYHVSEKDDIKNVIQSNKNLKWLRTGGKFSSTDLEWICQVPELRGLNLKHDDLSEADLNLLADLEKLQFLALDDSISQNPLPSIARLEVLFLDGPGIHDVHIPQAVQFPKLKAFSCKGSSVTDEGIEQLVAANPGLQYLTISDIEGITKNSVEEVGKLKELRYLHVGLTPLSNALAKLRKLLPNCEITAGY